MGRLRDFVLGFVQDVAETVVNTLDPIGNMTMQEAGELVSSPGGLDSMTLAEAERIYRVSNAISQALASGKSLGAPSSVPAAPEGSEIITDRTMLNKLAAQMGVDPSQVMAAYRTPVSSDLPPEALDENGQVKEEWAIDNCNCPRHKGLREERDAKKGVKRGREGDGGYI